MRKQKVLIQGNDEATIRQIREGVEKYNRVPLEIVERGEKDIDVCITPGIDKSDELDPLLKRLKTFDNKVRFVFYAHNHNRILTIQDIGRFQDFKIGGIIDLDRAESVKDTLEEMRTKDHFTSPLDIALYGHSKFNRSLLGLLATHPDIVNRIDWYSPSAIESTDAFVPNSTASYEGLIDAKDLRPMVAGRQLRTHPNLNSFAQAVADSDRIIFASGPPLDNYKIKVRGDGTENFYRYLFQNTILSVLRLVSALNENNSEAPIDNISNPNGALNLLLGDIYNQGRESISSTTPDGRRLNQIIAVWLKNQAERFNESPFKEIRERDPLSIADNIRNARVFGEHHNPILAVDDATIYETPIKDFKAAYKGGIQGLNSMFRGQLIKIGPITMIGSTEGRTDFMSSPFVVLKSLVRQARFQDPEDYETSARYNPDLGAFIQGDINLLKSSRRKTLIRNAQEQINLYDEYKEMFRATVGKII